MMILVSLVMLEAVEVEKINQETFQIKPTTEPLLASINNKNLQAVMNVPKTTQSKMTTQIMKSTKANFKQDKECNNQVYHLNHQ